MCAIHLRAVVVLVFLHNLGDAEVENLGHALVGDYDVGGLDVAVQNAMLVCIAHTVENGLEEGADAILHNQSAHIADIGVEVFAVGIFHDEVDVSFLVNVIVVESHDVGMIQFCQLLGLVLEELPRETVGHIGFDDLDGHLLLADKLVFSQINSAHTACSDKLDDAVIEDFFAYHDIGYISL